jgi:hypothetical protein
MRVRPTLALIATLAVTSLAGCLGTGEDRVLSVTSTGTVQGLVYFDTNGSGRFDEGDTGIPGVQIGLTSLGSIIPIYIATSDLDGLLEIRRVDVATYEVIVDTTIVGDSAQFVGVDPAAFTLTPDDTADITIGVSYPSVTIEDSKALPVGETVFVEGIALNDRLTFGDNTVHVSGRTLAIRTTNVRTGTVLVGDSIRILATTRTVLGQPVLDAQSVFNLAVTNPPDATIATASVASAADGGLLDAALVEVDAVTINDTLTTAEGFRLTVGDLSGTLLVLLDKDAPIANPELFVPGMLIDVLGLLVPDGTGSWILKPRTNLDLTIR